MEIKEAVFSGSSAHYKQCPQEQRPELALIGRSNVGKSSLINMILRHKGLAKISNTPGKTQLINHFLVNKTYYLVDLPGYGWARTSQSKRVQWRKMVSDYLLYRKNLLCVLVLIDARHKPQEIDLAFIRWLGSHQIPFIILMTKVDKISKQRIKYNIEALKQILEEEWEVLPTFLITSSLHQIGRMEILTWIDAIIHRTKS